MYLKHFGLHRPPFQITPNADFFYPGAQRKETLHGLTHAVQHNEGLIKVVGEIGSGKSLLCRMLASTLPSNFQVVFLANPRLAESALVEAILGDLNVVPDNLSYCHPTQQLQNYLLTQFDIGNRVVLLVEEAQAMPQATLEALRLLTNLETADTKLLRIVLFGQPELDQTLSQYNLRQFRDRITQSFYLRSVLLHETREYLQHRLHIAGYRGPALFNEQLVQQLHEATDGRLRPLNVIADKTLLAAFVDGELTLNMSHLTRAIDEIELQSPPPKNPANPTIPPIPELNVADSVETSWSTVATFLMVEINKLRQFVISIFHKSFQLSTNLLKQGKISRLINQITEKSKQFLN